MARPAPTFRRLPAQRPGATIPGSGADREQISWGAARRHDADRVASGDLGFEVVTVPSAERIDLTTARVLAAADAAVGVGPEACAAVLAATHAAAAVSADAVTPFVARLWFTPWRDEDPAHVRQRESTWLHPTEPVAVQAGEHRLAGFSAGDGPVVLLVHGWGDHAARLGAFVAPLVEAGLGVLGVDLPGHGRSGAAPSDLPQWTQAVSMLISAHHVQAIVAHSLGAQAAVHALRSAPGVRAAALLAPGVSLDHSVAGFASLFGLPPIAVAALRREIGRRFGEDVWQDSAADTSARHLRLPGLVVHSADDDRVAAADARLLAAAWPGARLRLLDGLGHSRLLRASAVVGPTVAFVSDAALGTGRG